MGSYTKAQKKTRCLTNIDIDRSQHSASKQKKGKEKKGNLLLSGNLNFMIVVMEKMKKGISKNPGNYLIFFFISKRGTFGWWVQVGRINEKGRKEVRK